MASFGCVRYAQVFLFCIAVFEIFLFCSCFSYENARAGLPTGATCVGCHAALILTCAVCNIPSQHIELATVSNNVRISNITGNSNSISNSSGNSAGSHSNTSTIISSTKVQQEAAIHEKVATEDEKSSEERPVIKKRRRKPDLKKIKVFVTFSV